MLDLAKKYEDILKEKFANTFFDFKYKYYYFGVYIDEYNSSNSTWTEHEFVSVNKNHEIIGYIAYSINRSTDSVNGFRAINFSDNKLGFGKDLIQVIDDIFTKFNFNKINFSVAIGNPIESTYDKYIIKYGGRIIGISEKDVKLLDGKLYDVKQYEIFRDSYIENKIS